LILSNSVFDVFFKASRDVEEDLTKERQGDQSSVKVEVTQDIDGV
jgi:hypothetical protein